MMAKIIVNNEVRTNGKLSATRALNEEKNGFIISGVFASHLYYENIKTLESERFALSGVEVYQESFGSDDYDILYYFTAKSLMLKDHIEDGIGYILYSDEMRMIEEEMYKDDHPILGGIGKEYKDMYIDKLEDSKLEEDEKDE